MRFSLALSILPLAISVGALSVPEPKKGDVIAPGASVDVKWTSVNTDASSFDIYLVNNAVYPPVNKKLVTNVESSKDSQNVNVGNIPAGPGYQINLVSDDPKNTGILAQTGQFNVTGSAESSTASTSTSSVTSTSSASSTSTAPNTSTNSTSHSTSASATTLTSHTSSNSTTSTASVTTSQIVTTSTGVSTTAVITSEVTKTSGHGMTTSASASGTAATTSAPSTGAGAAVMAHPLAALGVVGGALAFVL